MVYVVVYRSPPSEGAQGGPGRAAQNLRTSGESVPGDRHPEETGPCEHRQAGGGENTRVCRPGYRQLTHLVT